MHVGRAYWDVSEVKQVRFEELSRAKGAQVEQGCIICTTTVRRVRSYTLKKQVILLPGSLFVFTGALSDSTRIA